MRSRSLLAAVLAAVLAVPALATAQARKPAAQPARTQAAQPKLFVGGFLGYEMGDADGVQLRVDGEMPYQKLSPQVGLSFVGSVSYTHAGYDVVGADITVSRFKVVPAARFTLPLSREVSVFGDAGLGLHYTRVAIDYSVFLPDTSDSEISLLLRFGAGGFFQVNPRTRIGAAAMIDPIFGDYDDTTFTIMAGAMFEL